MEHEYEIYYPIMQKKKESNSTKEKEHTLTSNDWLKYVMQEDLIRIFFYSKLIPFYREREKS